MLTEYAGFMGGYADSLGGQQKAAELALDLIDKELAGRQ